MKPKVLLDISLLGHDKSIRRGMERVAAHLFEGLRKSDQCDLSFVATSHLAGAYDFLVAEGISPREKLRYRSAQLRASRLASRLSRIVHRTIENRSLPARAGRRMLAEVARFCTAGENRLTADALGEVDIYHSPHMPYPAAVRRQAGLRKFVTVHDFNPRKFPEYFTRGDTAFVDDLIACLTPDSFAFCVSETVRQDVLNASRIPPEHVFLTPLAADQNIFHPVSDAQKIEAARARYGIPDGAYFLTLSAHARHKNFAWLIHCFGALVESGELAGTSLVIAGPNPQRNPETREALAKYPRAKSRVVVAGFVPDEDLAAIYGGATAFLFPSLFEGFGIPPLEAMQCGTPVIASNTTSIPEVVGDAGILLSPTDADGWRQAMLQVFRQADLRAQLRQKALQRSKLFSWQRFIDETLRGYRKSLEMK